MVLVYSGLLSSRVLEYVKTKKKAVEYNKLVPLVYVSAPDKVQTIRKKKVLK